MIRKIALRACAAVVPAMFLSFTALPGTVHAEEDTAVAFRLSTTSFNGFAWVEKATSSAPMTIRGQSTTCRVAGVYLASGTPVPFVSVCNFHFEADASVSAACSGAFAHVSTLTFTIPGGPSVDINYDTNTVVTEGDGVGNGVNRIGLGHVHFAFESLCTTSPNGSAEGNLVGYTTAT